MRIFKQSPNFWRKSGTSLSPLDLTGKVGIGTTSPGAKLHVSGGDILLDNNQAIRFKDSGGTARVAFNVSGANNVVIGSNNLADMQLHVGTVGQAVTIKATTGNVGIGTTSPGYKLDVQGGATNLRLDGTSIQLPLQLWNNQAAAAGVGVGINLIGAGGVGLGQFQSRWEGSATTDSFFSFSTRGSNSVSEKIRITSTGNVGFGLTSPTAVAHIKAGTATAGTAPLKLTSGTLLTSPEAGAIEFLTDRFYATQTTGPTRKEIKLVDKYYGEMYEYENTTATVIGTQGVYHAVNNFSTGLLGGFTFVAGLDGSGTVTDYSGTVAGTVLLTDTAHGLLTGDIITVHNSTDYNGTFEITKVDDNSFYFTDTYTSDQSADWAMGSYLLASSGSDGAYEANFNLTAFTGAANLRFKFELNKNMTDLDNTANSRVFATASDYGVLSGGGYIDIVAGDRIWLSTRNETSNQDITIRHCNVRLQRL